MNRFYASLLLCYLLIGVGVLAGCDYSDKRVDSQREIGTVKLMIDFGSDNRAEEIDVVCSSDSTVLSTMERAQNMTKLKFKFRGSGETSFVTSIDGVENEGGDGQNWIFRVNDQLGDKSAGIFPVKPGDAISWSFGDRPSELK